MIQVLNLRAGHDDQLDTMYVYRPWNKEDVAKAVDGIPHPQTGVGKFIENMTNLRTSYCLNGEETVKVYRQALGADWCLISGDWSPFGNNNAILQWDEPDLNNRVGALNERIRTQWVHRPD